MSYRKSRWTVQVVGDPSVESGRLSARLLDAGEDPADRQAAAQELLDALCRDFGIPSVSVQVLDRPQPHSLSPSPRTGRPVVRWQEYGDYRETVRSGARVRIYNLTPRRRRPVSICVVAETALHEFMHHYDYHVLGLSYSFHTSGFFRRIRDLRRRFVPPARGCEPRRSGDGGRWRPVTPQFQAFVERFNRGAYREALDPIEELWRAGAGPAGGNLPDPPVRLRFAAT